MESCQSQTCSIINFRHGNFASMRFLKLFDAIILESQHHPTLSTIYHFLNTGDEFLYTGLKTVMNISEHGHFATLGQLDWVTDQTPFFVFILCIHFFFEHFSCFHSNTRQHSDPYCASQSVVDSSSNKTFAPLSGCD